MSLEDHRRLVEALIRTRPFPHPVDHIQLVETHISSVLLTGEYAYKIKKPVDLGFLDFTSLADRKRYCEEELRLNRRLAPRLYLAALPITGSLDAPRLGGDGEAIDYAIQMRQFDQSQLLDSLLARGELTARHIDTLADIIADFHGHITAAPPDSPFGEPERVCGPMAQNFEQIRALLHVPERLDQLDRLEAWTEGRYYALRGVLTARKAGGFIRECHGDMHLGNITLLDGEITIFDGIEFNDEFRWIDVMSEMAFITMDLVDRGATGFARRLLNRYLEHTGDYGGLRVLPFYQVYRAMVRAKIAVIRLGQGGLDEDERRRIMVQYEGYADLAERFTRPGQPRLLLMHGLSGSGKSFVSQRLLEMLDAVRVRSDRERKRLFEDSDLPDDVLNAGLYSPQATAATYERLRKLARTIIESGYTAIVDATFLHAEQRTPFARLAEELGCPYTIVHTRADEAVLRERVNARATEASNISDATESVLDYQMKHVEEPTAREPTMVVDTGRPIDIEALKRQILA